jgi:hypothetical protein
MRLVVLGLAIIGSIPACSVAPAGIEARPISFEVGVRDFGPRDDLVIDEVRSTDTTLSAGSLVTVRGRYRLGTRESARLYLGTTTSGTQGSDVLPEQQTRVDRGDGSFELVHRIPAAGHLHVTYYDPNSGRPFGGLYFGQSTGDLDVLRSKSWAYDR